MSFLVKSVSSNIATVTLNRGKVNPINEQMADELSGCIREYSQDPNVRALIITGNPVFFSFGLDIPEFLGYSKTDFTRFVGKFADLYTDLFMFPKPVIGALSGHTIAGGFMLATCCDYRIMVSGKSRISLNEITFGSSLFPGSAEMLKYCVGQRQAEIIAFTGAMYSAEEARSIGLIDGVCETKDLTAEAQKIATGLASLYGPAFESIKKLLRSDTAELMKIKDERHRDEMIDIWYSKETWGRLQQIKIHG